MNDKLATRDSVGVPAFMTDDGPLGTEEIGVDDVVIPRLKIVQGLTKAKQKNQELRDGEFYNSVEAKSYGKDVNLFVLLMWHSKVWFENFVWKGAEYTDMTTRQIVRIGDINFDDPKVYEKGKTCYNYMVTLWDQVNEALAQGTAPEILIFTAMSAAQKPARNLNGKLQSNGRKNIPIFGQLINVTTTYETFKEGSAHMPSFSFPKLATEDEYKLLKALYSTCKNMQSNKAAHEDKEPEEKEGKKSDIDSEDDLDDFGDLH